MYTTQLTDNNAQKQFENEIDTNWKQKKFNRNNERVPLITTRGESERERENPTVHFLSQPIVKTFSRVLFEPCDVFFSLKKKNVPFRKLSHKLEPTLEVASFLFSTSTQYNIDNEIWKWDGFSKNMSINSYKYSNDHKKGSHRHMTLIATER